MHLDCVTAGPWPGCPRGAAAWSSLCRVSGAGLDPEWRVNAECRAHHGQLVAGGGAAAEGARTVPARHRGADARPGLGTRPLQPQDQPVKSPHTALTLGAKGGLVEPQTAALTSLQFVTRGGSSLATAVMGGCPCPPGRPYHKGPRGRGWLLLSPCCQGPGRMHLTCREHLGTREPELGSQLRFFTFC